MKTRIITKILSMRPSHHCSLADKSNGKWNWMSAPSKAFLAVTVISLLSVGCTSPELTQRYEKIKEPVALECDEDSKQQPLVSFSVFALDSPKPTSKTTITSLSDRGQASLVTALGEKSKGSKELLATLGTPIKSPEIRPGLIDKTQFKKLIVYSIVRSPMKPSPADRIDKIQITSSLVKGDAKEEGDAKFLNWDKLDSKYEFVQLGELTLNKSISGSLDASLKPPQIKELDVLSANLGFGRSINEVLKLQRRYVALSSILGPQEVTIIQEGAVGIDLTGNLSINVQVQLKKMYEVQVAKFPPLFEIKKEKPKSPSESIARKPISPELAAATFTTVRVPKIPGFKSPTGLKPLNIFTDLEYVVRHVEENKGDKTIAEGDDFIVYHTGIAPCKDQLVTELIPVEEMKFKTWEVTDRKGNILSIGKRIEGTWLENPVPIDFLSANEAVALREWLILSKKNFNKRIPTAGGKEFALCPYNNLDECKELDLDKDIKSLTISVLYWNFDIEKIEKKRDQPKDY